MFTVSNVDVIAELKAQSKLLKEISRKLDYTSFGFPLLSDKWLWQQFTLPLFTVKANGTVTILTEKDLYAKQGFLHSLDLAASSGDLVVELKARDPTGNLLLITGSLQNFWLAGFNPRQSASAGDPIVVNTAVDEPVGFPAVPEWKTRISPSFNVPFNVPFSWKLINPDPTAITVYSHDLYFLLLKN